MDIKSLDDLRRNRGPADPELLKKAREEIQNELPLAALRKAVGVTQAEMAGRLGKSQAAVSKFEGRGDFLCSTLFRYAQSLGAEIELKINVASKRFCLSSHEEDGDLYFLLSEQASQSCDRKIGENILNFHAFSGRVRRKVVPGSFDRALEMPAHSTKIDADLFNLEASHC